MNATPGPTSGRPSARSGRTASGGRPGAPRAGSAHAGLLRPRAAPLARVTAPVGRALAPAARTVGPVTSAVSPFGWAALVVTVAAWWAGLALSWLELLVVAVLLTV
ncbi:MAG: hypothetical protein ACTMHU_12675, partial [Cellulosimicrobium funkei]